MRVALRVALVISAVSLAGCASMHEKRMQLQGESTAARPESVKPSIGIEETLRCIRETGKLRKVIFAIGPHTYPISSGAIRWYVSSTKELSHA